MWWLKLLIYLLIVITIILYIIPSLQGLKVRNSYYRELELDNDYYVWLQMLGGFLVALLLTALYYKSEDISMLNTISYIGVILLQVSSIIITLIAMAMLLEGPTQSIRLIQERVDKFILYLTIGGGLNLLSVILAGITTIKLKVKNKL